MHLVWRAFFTLLIALGCISRANATTWNEPWHREVVRDATALGLYEVLSSDARSVTLKRIKQLAGEDTGDKVKVDSFYALALTSLSGDGPELRFRPGLRAYFYLKRTAGAWAIATPSAGWAPVQSNGMVAATYRFSAHQALVEAPLYELTQRCVFIAVHKQGKCDTQVSDFISAELAKPPEALDGENVNGFFRQHVALETAYILNYPLGAKTIEPFLSKPDMHVQISAVRALAASQLPGKAERLMRFVEDDRADMTARIMATLMLREIGAHAMKQRLLEYSKKAPKLESGLGIAIMDPRIGTAYPQTIAEAAKEAGEQL